MTEVQTAAVSRVREYETIYVLRPNASRESSEKTSARVEEVVAREGGKLTLVETWGRRQLAYAIGKCKRGVYVYVKYLGGGRLVAELERNLRMLDDVLTYQTVRVREDVDLNSVDVRPEDVEFEAVEPPAEDEAEESLARVLGLEEPPREPPPARAESPAPAGAGEPKHPDSEGHAAKPSDAGPAAAQRGENGAVDSATQEEKS